MLPLQALETREKLFCNVRGLPPGTQFRHDLHDLALPRYVGRAFADVPANHRQLGFHPLHRGTL